MPSSKLHNKGFSALARSGGFTLVELLVTISILAILMTIAIIYYGNVQKGARDARRKSDISNIQSALEQYHADQGFYPITGDIIPGNPIISGSKTYLSKVPTDPTSGTYSYIASGSSNSKTTCDYSTTRCINYCLYATVENSPNATVPSLTLCSAAPAAPAGSTFQTQAP